MTQSRTLRARIMPLRCQKTLMGRCMMGSLKNKVWDYQSLHSCFWKIIILIRKLCISNKEPVVLLESFGPSWLFCITANEDISTYAHAITICTQVEVHSQSWRFFAEEPETLADAPAASLLNAVSGYCPSGKSKKGRRRS